MTDLASLIAERASLKARVRELSAQIERIRLLDRLRKKYAASAAYRAAVRARVVARRARLKAEREAQL